MGSQLDLDQGGTPREWVSTYLGPSVGWVSLPGRNPLTITAAGTYTALIGTSLVLVNVVGLVTIFLPSVIDPVVPAGAMPGPYGKTPITLTDLGGHAQAFNITIKPASVAETIMGLTQITIKTPYAGYILYPDSANRLWTNLS